MMIRRPRNHFRLKFRKNTTLWCTCHMGHHLQIVNQKAISWTEWSLIVSFYLLQALITIIEAMILAPLRVLLRNLNSLAKSLNSTSRFGNSRWITRRRTMPHACRGELPSLWECHHAAHLSQLSCVYPERQFINVFEDCFHFGIPNGVIDDSSRQSTSSRQKHGSSKSREGQREPYSMGLLSPMTLLSNLGMAESLKATH